jgi:hypothetical protein
VAAAVGKGRADRLDAGALLDTDRLMALEELPPGAAA